MDEYIKREDALDAVLFALVGTGHQSDAIYAVRDVPTADVVPKSEVEELKAIIADHKASEERLEELYSNAKADVARKIFEEVEGCFMFGERIYSIDKLTFAELKKKYTEGKK